jgi:two-component system, chemotaxis family, sensor kinase CheA
VTQFSDDRGAELKELFFESAQELLQSLNEEALKLEKQPGDVEIVRTIRRVVHTLKGDAAACGYRELSNSAHELEDALALENASSHATLAEVAFAAADTFATMVTAYHHKTKVPSDEPLRKLIRGMTLDPETKKRTRKTASKASKVAVQTAWTEYEKLAMEKALAQGTRVFHITAVIDPHCAMPIAARQLLLNALGAVGKILGARPEPGSAKSAKQVELLFASDRSADQITAKCSIPTVISQINVEMLKATAHKGKPAIRQEAEEEDHAIVPSANLEAQVKTFDEAQSGAAQPLVTTAAENILRVDAERIDSVLNLVGELIIGKSMLQMALLDFSRRFPKDATRARFSDAMAFQARVLGDLQRSVMKIRMVPVEQLFRRFPRMVRDVARQCGKEVELVLRGQDTDLDKSLLDAIAEPLTHLVRNAVSHGIEGAEERVRGGKPAHGTIRLSAYHHGNQVVVEVSDDGRGIDAQKVKAKALEKGLITFEDADRLSEADVLELVLRPGFSTADEITEIAGRGVGLDVVQNVLNRLKGTVDIETHSGRGTTFRLQLPLTLAIIKALLFRVEQRLYDIPLNGVAEIARAQESDLHLVDGYEVLQLRNQVLPLVRLGRPPAQRSGAAAGKIFILVIASGERKLGLIVEALEGEEELVIKALDDQTVATDLVSGASILGDGRVVLIVNLAAILEHHARSRPREAGGITSGILLPRADQQRIVAKPAAGVQP